MEKPILPPPITAYALAEWLLDGADVPVCVWATDAIDYTPVALPAQHDPNICILAGTTTIEAPPRPGKP